MVSSMSNPASVPPPYSPPLPMPHCSRCDAGPSDLHSDTAGPSNPNGNAGRPYLKCKPCNKFVTWTDRRGVGRDDEGGPECHCHLPARLQVAGRVGVVRPRGLHYVCSVGSCGYYAIREDRRGEQAVLTEDLVDLFAWLNLI